MKVLDGHKAEDVNKVLKESLAEKTIVFSDKSKSYVDIAQYVEAHIWQKSTKETTTHQLKWVHIAIANAKRTFLGVYHKMSGKYLQNYLNEFVYKLNRRNFKSIFERLALACVILDLVN